MKNKKNLQTPAKDKKPTKNIRKQQQQFPYKTRKEIIKSHTKV